MGAMASRVVPRLPCGSCGGKRYSSTSCLEFSARRGGILEDAAQQTGYQEHLAKFLDSTEPLDLQYTSIQTHWAHHSNIPLRSLRLVRSQADNGTWEQTFYIDDVKGGEWFFQAPRWLGLERAPGLVRFYEAVLGTRGWYHRADIAEEFGWSVVLMPLVDDYTGDRRPLA